jgi:hypothetical protein
MATASFCPNCGAAVAGTRFCPECGTSTALGAAQEKPAELNHDEQVRVGSAEQMLARLRTRFVDRPEHESVINHPKFDDFLIRKAQELTARH